MYDSLLQRLQISEKYTDELGTSVESSVERACFLESERICYRLSSVISQCGLFKLLNLFESLCSCSFTHLLSPCYVPRIIYGAVGMQQDSCSYEGFL